MFNQNNYQEHLKNLLMGNERSPVNIIKASVLLTPGAVHHICQTIYKNADYINFCPQLNNLQAFLEKKGAAIEEASKITCAFSNLFKHYYSIARTHPHKNICIQEFQKIINAQFPKNAGQTKEYVDQTKNIAPSRAWQHDKNAQLTDAQKKQLKQQEKKNILSTRDLVESALRRLALSIINKRRQHNAQNLIKPSSLLVLPLTRLLNDVSNKIDNLCVFLKQQDIIIQYNKKWTVERLNHELARNPQWRDISFEDAKILEYVNVPNIVAENVKQSVINIIQASHLNDVNRKIKYYIAHEKPASLEQQEEFKNICNKAAEEYFNKHLNTRGKREQYATQTDERRKKLRAQFAKNFFTKETTNKLIAYCGKKADGVYTSESYEKDLELKLITPGFIHSYQKEENHLNNNINYKIYLNCLNDNDPSQQVMMNTELVRSQHGTCVECIKIELPKAISANNDNLDAWIAWILMTGPYKMDIRKLDKNSRQIIRACCDHLLQRGLEIEIISKIEENTPKYYETLTTLRRNVQQQQQKTQSDSNQTQNLQNIFKNPVSEPNY